MRHASVSNRKTTRFIVALTGFLLLGAGLIASISVGAADISAWTVVQAIFDWNGSKEQLIIQMLRLPRAVIGALIGANLAVAGALMQALTRNPLASPQVFGINAGASLMVVASLVFLPALGSSTVVYFAFLGAALGGCIVYSISSSGGITPVKLALAGMAVHLLLSSLTQGLIIFNEQISDVLYWLTGAIDGSTWDDVTIMLPWSVAGLILAFLLSGSISVLGLGDDVARGLGQKINRVRLLAGLLVIILAGSSVAVAGPIGFIGLMVPHIVRKMVGEDYRVVLPVSALCGAVLLVYADVLARFIAFPYESPVGIVTAMIGAPFFLYLARKERTSR